MMAFQFLNLAMVVFSALMLWKGLMVITGSESPVVVVLSGSMRPAVDRGDILFLNNHVRSHLPSSPSHPIAVF
jgi:signal peptidase